MVLKYQKRIYFLIRRMVLVHEDADDIVQDAFVKAYVNLHRFDEAYAFYPWLRRIAMNTMLNHFSRQSRRREKLPSVNEALSKRAPAGDADPLGDVIQRELETQVAEAVKRLPIEQRTIFVLRTNEGLSYHEIGEQLNLSQGTVMSRLSRARAKLKEWLQPYLETQDIEVKGHGL